MGWPFVLDYFPTQILSVCIYPFLTVHMTVSTRFRSGSLIWIACRRCRITWKTQLQWRSVNFHILANIWAPSTLITCWMKLEFLLQWILNLYISQTPWNKLKCFNGRITENSTSWCTLTKFINTYVWIILICTIVTACPQRSSIVGSYFLPYVISSFGRKCLYINHLKNQCSRIERHVLRH